MGNLEALSKTRASIAMLDRNTNNSYLLDTSARRRWLLFACALLAVFLASGSFASEPRELVTRATGDIKGIFCKETYPNERS